MKHHRRSIHGMRVIIPWLTAAVLMGMSVILPNRSALNPDALSHQTQVAAAINEAPFFVGRWVGEDASQAIPREAQKLLHPNAILSRTYRSPAGPSVHVLLVHCRDARDMIGHYPPVCYPSTGWLNESTATSTAVVRIGDHEVPVRHYVFERHGERGNMERIRILNAFILPGGQVALDIEGLHRQSERLALTIQGVAQLQVITAASTTLEESVDAASEILSGMPAIFKALQVGEENRSET